MIQWQIFSCCKSPVSNNAKKLTCKRTWRQVFNRVIIQEIANFLRTFSHIGFFNPALLSVIPPVAPLPFSLVQLSPIPPPLPCVNKYTVCKGGGWYRVLGLRQINSCRKVPLQVKFCIVFSKSYLSVFNSLQSWGPFYKH
jgi:hypothetical protein